MTALTLPLLLGAFVLGNCQQADMTTKKELTDLFNSPVKTAEVVVLPKQTMPNNARSYVTTHSGVRVTLEDGRKYLVHNVPNRGTVVTDAGNMSDRWRVKKTQDVGGHATVGDFRAAAGTRVVGRHCHDTRRRMMKAARRRTERKERRRSRKRSG